MYGACMYVLQAQEAISVITGEPSHHLIRGMNGFRVKGEIHDVHELQYKTDFEDAKKLLTRIFRKYL